MMRGETEILFSFSQLEAPCPRMGRAGRLEGSQKSNQRLSVG